MKNILQLDNKPIEQITESSERGLSKQHENLNDNNNNDETNIKKDEIN